MSGFDAGDWVFIVFIMLVIVACVGISDLRKK
jgi:hypothetical protein